MLRKYILVFTAVIIAVPLAFVSMAPVPAESADNGNSKISGLLRLQVQTKLNKGAGAGLEHGAMFPMTEGGPAGFSEPESQKIYIYFDERPDEARIAELEAEGITVYPDSWVPPFWAI